MIKPDYIIRFLGQRIAVQDEMMKNRYHIRVLYGILANGSAIVGDPLQLVDWSRLESPYMIIDDAGKEIIL